LGFGAYITTGSGLNALSPEIMAWLVEVRVEMELSKPTRYALRFEDDICDGSFAVQGNSQFKENEKLGIFVADENDEPACLVYGPVTEVKSSNALGGPGSWVEIHGEDRRAEMGRVDVQAKYTGLASAAAKGILSAYEFTPETQDTLIQYDGKKKQLSQRGTDLAFLEEIARKNNMEFWLEYKTTSEPLTGKLTLKETANLRTSPERSQAGAVPQVPTLAAPPGMSLAVNPPRRDCPGMTKFEARIDYEKPVAAKGFTFDASGDKSIVEQIVAAAEPVDPERPVQVSGVKREVIIPAKVDPEEAFLAMEAIVTEQSWFVEVDASTTFEQAGFLIRPHQIVQFTSLDDRLAGSYQVTKALHVITAADHFIDFTSRANGLGGSA
jgi:hypothetical protein